MDKLDKKLLQWDEEKDLGFCSVRNTWYDDFYFEEGIVNSQSPIARELNTFRVSLVNSFTSGLVLDFGCGVETFMRWRGNCLGFEVIPRAMAQLHKEGLFFDPYKEDLNKRGIAGVTFFDSLEHLYEPEKILERITKQYVFVSLPIFKDKAHVLASRHFRPREHYWYFTQRSFRVFVKRCGFEMLDYREDETRIGRDSIGTFVFRRAQ